ncbi:MAG: hypothetical protein KDA21_00410 [Phycisphaerales bacterium]|nr:hypothetical protein [Phycisphaerales bacterium]
MNGRDFVCGMLTGGAILVAGALIGGLAPKGEVTTFETVDAKEFRLVDGSGTVVGLLTSSTRGSGALTLFDDTGKPMFAAGVGESGGLFQALDRTGAIRTEINAAGEVIVYSEEGELRARMACYKQDGNLRQTWAGQFTAFDRNRAIVGRVPRDGLRDQ